MGMDSFPTNKPAITDPRFLSRKPKFSLERFHDCSFFNRHESQFRDGFVVEEDEDDGDGDQPREMEERGIYWESQQFLLQEILEQYDSIGSKLREQIKRQIEMIARESNFCSCLDKNLRGCLKCLRQAAVNHLCSKGFSAFLCTSQWKTTRKTPGGSHEYIQVIASTQRRRKQIPFLVELGLRDEFKMAKACDEYTNLINHLPEIYIGKSEHLNAIIRLVCEAAKKSTEELKIYMGPWRKRSFMEMKWSASSERRLDRSSNEVRISSSTQERVITAAPSFQLPMAITVKVV